MKLLTFLPLDPREPKHNSCQKSVNYSIHTNRHVNSGCSFVTNLSCPKCKSCLPSSPPLTGCSYSLLGASTSACLAMCWAGSGSPRTEKQTNKQPNPKPKHHDNPKQNKKKPKPECLSFQPDLLPSLIHLVATWKQIPAPGKEQLPTRTELLLALGLN